MNAEVVQVGFVDTIPGCAIQLTWAHQMEYVILTHFSCVKLELQVHQIWLASPSHLTVTITVNIVPTSFPLGVTIICREGGTCEALQIRDRIGSNLFWLIAKHCC